MTEINPVKITSLPDATTITGDEYFPIVQAGQTRKVPISGAAHGLTQGFVTFAGMANLPNARNLKVSDYLGITDGGAGEDLTIGTTLQATIDALQAQLDILGTHNYQVVQDADNAPALNSLMSTLSSQNGGFIIVSEGNMNNGRLVPKSNIALIFSGRRSTLKTSVSRVAIFQDDPNEDLINFSVSNGRFIGGVTEEPSTPQHFRSGTGVGITTAFEIHGNLEPTSSYPTAAGVKKNIYFVNNWVEKTSSLPILIGGAENVYINNNNFYNCKDVGARFNKNVQCLNNRVEMSQDNGISLSRGNDGVVASGNIINNCAYDGIWLGGVGTDDGCKNFTVTGNEIQDVGYNGINAKLAAKNGVISGNFIRQGYWRGPTDQISNINSGTGITVGGIPDHSAATTSFADNILVTSNTIMECSRAGLFSTGGTSNCTMANNKILNVGNQYAADGVTAILSSDITTNCGIIFENTGANFNNRVINNTVDDTRATTYMNYPISPTTANTTFSAVRGNEGNGSWRNPATYFWVTGYKQSFASGTSYQLTATSAKITFGTTSPTITFTEKGQYLIFARCNLRYNGATFAASRTVTLKVRDITNSVDLSSGSATEHTDVVTTKTATMADVTWIPLVFSSQGNETLELWGDVSVVPTAGSLDVNQAAITAMKIGG